MVGDYCEQSPHMDTQTKAYNTSAEYLEGWHLAVVTCA